MITVDVTLTDDRLANLPAEIRGKAARHIRRTAFKVEEYAKASAPVDTGFLRNSIYTVTSESSGYDKAQTTAERTEVKCHAGQRKSSITGEWRNVRGQMLPEVDAPRDDLTAIVAVGAEYGAYVNYGTARAAAQPYLDEAIEQARDFWEEGLRELFR